MEVSSSLCFQYLTVFVFCSNEGRPLLSEEVILLQEEIGKLYNELNRIDFVEDDGVSEEQSVAYI